jgi:catechol 2,3-dioxygenase-like lactoylglutathione lyase family enzyme
MLKYMGPLVVVDEIETSRYFYEQLLGQKVKYDFGPNVAFERDFSIHLKSHFQTLLGDGAQHPITKKSLNLELTFETDEIETIYQVLPQAAVAFIHTIQEQPWGQRVMRLYDPDGHVIEIGETMDATVWRLYGQGLSTGRIREKTGMPMEFVEQAILEYGRTGQGNSG